VIRSGRQEAQVEALFEVPANAPVRSRWLLPADAALDENLVVKRIISRSGRGRALLGGSLATLGDLGASVGTLVDITSQHDQQSLMDPESQRDILDAFAENGDLVKETGQAHAALTAAEAALAAFDADAKTRSEREDLLRFQLGELDEAAPKPGEDDALRIERERIKGAEKFLGACARGEETLYSGEVTAAGQIAAVARDLAPLATLDATLAPLVERLREAQALVEDAASDLGRYASNLRFDPGRLEEVEERLFLLTRLCRKHGGTLAAALDRREVIARELDEMGSFEEAVTERRKAVADARAKLSAIAGALSERRRKAARRLGKRIDETLHELGLAVARVSLLVEAREEAGAKGADRVRFLFAPNPGEEPRPLDRIASGGELSRVMLAVKQALASADQALTYVFDEVDTGVGGGTAEVIGRKLKSIAADRQVLAVTHLPQIAAFADHHYRVTKETRDGRTTLRVDAVTGKERTAEIARMLAGASPSRQATAHADEMLRQAQRIETGARI
jgi:DNA repair protein RecN (Recombination protein N)